MRLPSRHSKLLRFAALVALSTVAVLQGCGETLTQVSESDVVELRASADSAQVAVGREIQLRAYPLDVTGALLVGTTVDWESTDPSVASVDEAGVVTGTGVGTTDVVVSLGALSDTTHMTVALAAAIALSDDSVGFEATAGGSDPAPQSVDVANAGDFPIVGFTVDSIVYGAGASGWLAAAVDQPNSPSSIELTPAVAGVTAAGTYTASVWVSATDADGSPAEIEVTLRVTAGTAASLEINDGNGQTADAGAAVATAPSVLLEDAFGNPVGGASVTFAVTGGGGSLVGTPATTNAAGIARVTSWTLGTVAGANQVTASFGVLAPVAFDATGVPGPASQVVVTSGDNQSAVAGNAVATPPSVTVQDQHGNGVAGVAVTFSVASGGGSVTGASQTSDANGVATVGSWTLGTTAGASNNTLSVTAAGVATPAVVTASALSGAASAIQLQGGNAQSDSVAATLPTAYAVRVVDINMNGVAGIPVTWTVTGGTGGTIGGSPTSVAIPTDASGVSSAVRVLGTVPGTHTATASVGGLSGSPVQFSATASVGSPHQILINAGNAQTDTVRGFVDIDPQVRVTDRFNNPIAGHSVTFSVTGSNGIVVPATAITTAANGTATVTSWQLGTATGSGNNQLRATAAGPGIAGQFVTFTASATAGSPTSIGIVQGNNQTAESGSNVAITPTVVVRDQFNNPVPSRTVNFTTSGGFVGSPSPSTNASGQASSSWAPNVSGGVMQTDGTFPDVMTATVSGTALSTQFSADAIYSYATHVNGLWSSTGCTGCHTGSPGTSNLSLSGSSAANYSALVNVLGFCDTDSSLAGSGYRRISSAGGTSGHTLSILRILMESSGDAIDTCGPHGFLKLSSPNLDIVRAWIRNGAPNN